MFELKVEDFDRHDIPTHLLEEAFARNWFKLFTPAALGGLESTLVDGLSTLIDAAALHGGLGWVVNLGAGAGYFAPAFDRDTALNLLGGARAVIAGSGKSIGNSARPVSGGYEITGMWDLCSGAAHATLFTVSALLEEGDIKCFVLPRDVVQVTNEDYLFGLSTASSSTIEVARCVVPEPYAFDIGVVRSDYEYPLQNVPFLVFARLCMCASYIGMCECFVRLCAAGRSRTRVECEIAGATDAIQQAREELIEWGGRVWRAGSDIRPEDGLNHFVDTITSQLSTLCARLFLKGGLSLSDQRSVAHWAYRDVLTAGHHFLLHE